jgi:hypothetical protein
MTAVPVDPAATAIFAGPSLAGSPFAGLLRERIHPPLCAGDLTMVTRTLSPGSRLLIIDGEFGQSQAVTPTEIREATEAGFRVYGASSMGALRAVECAAVGMVGLGHVYADYAAGRIVADDEVALTYNPETYAPFTVPLVNVRRYLGLLGGFGASPDARSAIFQEARAVHFRERSFTALGKLAEHALPREVADAARGLLEQPARRLWDVKLADAELAITAVLSGNVPPPDTVLAPVPDDPVRLLQPETGSRHVLGRDRGRGGITGEFRAFPGHARRARQRRRPLPGEPPPQVRRAGRRVDLGLPNCPPRRRRRDPEASRAAMIEAARAVFTERGYARATIREIARRAGVTHGLVMRHFGSKERLLIEALPGPRAAASAVPGELATLPERVAATFVAETESAGGGEHAVVALIRSAASGKRRRCRSTRRWSARPPPPTGRYSALARRYTPTWSARS